MTGMFAFIGSDSSRERWYRKGTVYMLEVKDPLGKPRIMSPYECPYDSVEKFQENWRFIKDLEV